MKPSDLPRFYRAALTYHPEIGTFRGGRGAWRVQHCFATTDAFPLDVSERRVDSNLRRKVLYMDVARKLKDCTFVNPTKLLREMFVQQRIRRMNAAYFPGMYP